MTSKLIKYEFRSALRQIGIIWAALMAAAVLLGVLGLVFDSMFGTHQGSVNIFENLLTIVPPLIYFTIFIAMLVVTVLIVVLRFYKGLLGDEGYLMHTLPVKPWQLITAKGVVAGAVVIISIIAAVLSIMILVAFDDAGSMMEGMKDFFAELGKEPRLILVIIEGIVICVFSVLKSIYQIYAAMAIGQLSNKYRMLTSLGAYIGISIVLTILATIAISVFTMADFDIWLDNALMDMNIYEDGFGLVQAGMGAAFVLTFIQLAAFHVIAERILSKKLNLI